jgi:hypothetical protein
MKSLNEMLLLTFSLSPGRRGCGATTAMLLVTEKMRNLIQGHATSNNVQVSDLKKNIF